jgi:hypothetical protein
LVVTLAAIPGVFGTIIEHAQETRDALTVVLACIFALS